MKKHNLISILLLSTLFIGCNGSKSATEKYFSFDESKFKSEYNNDDSLSLRLLNVENKKIDSIVHMNLKVDS
jgi:hypothetical protein